jgi:hypothetical protein
MAMATETSSTGASGPLVKQPKAVANIKALAHPRRRQPENKEICIMQLQPAVKLSAKSMSVRAMRASHVK